MNHRFGAASILGALACALLAIVALTATSVEDAVGQEEDEVTMTVTMVVLGSNQAFEVNLEGALGNLSDGQQLDSFVLKDDFTEVSVFLEPGWTVRDFSCDGAGVWYESFDELETGAFLGVKTRTSDFDCTVVMGPVPQITITKVAVGGGADGVDFNFSGPDDDFVVASGDSVTLEVVNVLRNVVIDENNLPAGWAPVEVSCTGSDEAGGAFVDYLRVILFIDPGEDFIECTYVNTITPALYCNGLLVTISVANPGWTGLATPGDDVILGTSGADSINGRGGNDTICGGGGDDIIRGGPGDDYILGEGGNDDIKGDGGNDVIYGDIGDDTIRGGPGVDVIAGNIGADVIKGDGGDDTLNGNDGDDEIRGGPGVDVINGNDGDDLLMGGDGADLINGNDGDDDLRGQNQDDELHGGMDDDIVRGGDGDDVMTGSSGIDTLYGNLGADDISGGADNDLIRGNQANDIIKGDSGDDYLSGGDADDTVYGGPGDDDCYGNQGADTAQASTCEFISAESTF